jgi:hypothetical protein
MTFKAPAPNSVLQPVGISSKATLGSMDNLGRLRTSRHQNIYEADFEYSAQPMRWENYIVNNSGVASVQQFPGSGGVRMRIGTSAGDATIRQTRPYHRYQPGKTMVMSTALNFGVAQTGQRQRVGFFDDSNGIFLEQADPVYTASTSTLTGNSVAGSNIITGLSSTASMYIGMPVTGANIDPSSLIKDPNGALLTPYTTTVTGIINSTAVAISSAIRTTSTGTSYTFTTQANPFGMYCVVRSDVNQASINNTGTAGGIPTDYRTPLPCWNGDQAVIANLDWSRIQMVWMEYTWYGAGMTRWGVVINGEWVVLHYIGYGNKGPLNLTLPTGTNSVVYPSQQAPWSRTGNLPVRYEQRNISATSSQNDMYHYGVSVVVEGGQDEQRGFTYSYGMSSTTPNRAVPSSNTRYPVLSVASRPMGTIEWSGNSTFNAANSSSNTTSIQFTTANTTFDGITSSSLSVSYGTTSSVVTVTSGSTANVFVGQIATSNYAGDFATGTTVTYVNSTAYVLSSTPTVTRATATANTITNNTFVGRHIYFPAQGTNQTGITGRITSSNSTVIAFGNIINSAPIANTASMTGTTWQIGLINRGQLLPKKMYVSATNQCIIELITSTTSNPILLTAGSWNTLANVVSTNTIVGSVSQATGVTFANGNPVNISGLGSNYSFGMRDVSATAMTGGEVVFAFTSPTNSGLQEIDLSYFFALYNTISGNLTDTLTVAVTTGATGSNVACHIIAQEAMS